MDLTSPLTDLDRIYKMYASRLAKLDIYTMYDMLFHIPTRYDDFSLISPINRVQAGETVTVQGSVVAIKNTYTKTRKAIQQATIKDVHDDTAEIIWFNQPYLTKTIHTGDTLSISGRVEKKNNHILFTSPEFEVLRDKGISLHTGRLVPVYPETKGVSSKWLRRQLHKILQKEVKKFSEYMPPIVLEEEHLMPIVASLEQIHFPDSFKQATMAKERLAFDELFFMQLTALYRRQEWKKNIHGHRFHIDTYRKNLDEFFTSLPFHLTNAQKNALDDIFSDMTNPQPMNRLVQGDVGSGKTIVAAASLYVAFLNGFQSVFMAPTEILAQQHFKTISSLLTPLGVQVEIITGNNKRIKNQELRIKKNNKTNNHDSKFMIDDSDILVGTHAVLSEKVKFKNLGLVVIDEQQRFGVEQRTIITEKGNNPHLLSMTATPIPRTIALTMYGDLDISVLDEMPKGRKKIKTWLVPNEKREAGYQWIERQITQHSDQAFIVCPFIEPSENSSTIKAATAEFEHLQKDVFKHLRLGLLHGKMKQKEKDEILQKFGKRQLDILVATPVVEVGIDFPNATIIVIEAAERFGLAQLHQLRGRVGRGDKQSYCLLYTDSQNVHTRERLSAMQTMHIGSDLAELDLKLRGPGELYGTAQHGRRVLKIASFSDFPLIARARKQAQKIFKELARYPKLLEKLQEQSKQHISPN